MHRQLLRGVWISLLCLMVADLVCAQQAQREEHYISPMKPISREWIRIPRWGSRRFMSSKASSIPW